MPIIRTLKNGHWVPCTTIDDLPLATQLSHGLMSSADKSKLDDVADYIVEQGTSGIWTYEKWASGKAKCWGKFSQNVSAYSQGAFIVGNTSVSAYPFNFVSAPILTTMVQRIGSGGGYATYDYDRTDYANFVVNSTAQIPTGTAENIIVKCYAIGRWK